MFTPDEATPTVLAIFPESWLARRRAEWEALAAAAARAGFRTVIAGWNALEVGDGSVRTRDCMLQTAGETETRAANDLSFVPTVTLTTWGVEWEHRELFEQILAGTGCYYGEWPLLAWLDGKCELELCLRRYEERLGRAVSRPRTLLPEEIPAEGASLRGELVIVKPSRGGQCKGIEILPRAALPVLAEAARTGARSRFVAQELVAETFLCEGKRWDVRVHAMATSLSPLRYSLYREGVAKTAAMRSRPGSDSLEEWLNAESFLDNPSEHTRRNLSISEMLLHLADAGTPLPDFWERLEVLVGDVFAAIALLAREEGHALGRAFLFPGFDLIVERTSERGYELRLLEINSHPGLAWRGRVGQGAAPTYDGWFRDLQELTREGSAKAGRAKHLAEDG